MTKTVFILVLSIYTITSFSQISVLNGYVVDKKTGEAIIGANITDLTTHTGTTSNKFGFFSLSVLKNENHTLQFSYIGYDARTISFNLNTDTIFTIEMSSSNTELKEVLVFAAKNTEEKAEIGRINIPLSTIRTLPSITGEPDILKAYQLMPGIQMGAENNNGLYVRGGSPDQNLILLDDVTLYNVSHLGGFFSVFDPSMVKSIDLYKGGFPARYGGRLSSVVDVRNKDGNLYKSNGEIALGLISSKVFLEGPIKKGESSYAFSFRNCNFGAYSYLYNILKGIKYTEGYYFYDINFKANLKLSQSDRLFLSFYSGEDNIYYKEKKAKNDLTNIEYSGLSELKWGNTAGSVRWLHIFKNGIFNNTTLAFTNYNYVNRSQSSAEYLIDNSKITDYYRIKSGIDDFQIKNDAEIPFENLTFRFGALAGSHSHIPGVVSYSQTTSETKPDSVATNSSVRLKSVDVYGYAEFEYKLTDKFSANTGLRTGLYIADNTAFPVLEPRVVLNYLFLPSYSIKASYSKMHQNIHLLTNSNGGLPTDVWVPSTKTIKPQSSNQLSIGFAHTTKKNYELNVELYTKKIKNLIDYKAGTVLYNNLQNWEQKVETGGIGDVKGLELLFQKKTGTLTGWIGYTLSSNTRIFENLNNGKEYPYTYDQTHNISIVGNYKITENITFSATWVYHTGNCITLPSAKYQLYNYDYNNPMNKYLYTDVEIYTDKNGYRLPDYHRLDISLNRSKQLEKGIRNWSINIFNAYNRQNASYVFYKKSKDDRVGLYQGSFFPILLNITYSYKW
ncbi:MAG: TonB-dependent receptor [Paludibacteraceae bacterium]|nr:TonB-dependent receptor [Paludibacteraceae bacterium]